MIYPVIAVFAGGTSRENEVSRGSGAACALALSRSFPTRLFKITADALPEGYDPRVHVVFSTLHGTFGEDGGMQRLLDAAGGAYSGSDAFSSALTMDKEFTKRTVAEKGVTIAPGIVFDAASKPSAADVVGRLGAKLILKPNNEGSSVGLHVVGDEAGLTAALATVSSGRWIIERRIEGREISVGVLHGKGVGIVEIRPHSGIFDYKSKYTMGASEDIAPAPIGDVLTARAIQLAEAAFAACGCRDYARIDFMISSADELFLLEINTLPGMVDTSLLPMCARCAGLDFTALVREMVSPAVERFRLGAATRSP
ncbi:MAG TPA: D-alanine--D-alanine ligase [Opitutaceae bacterium]|nr:D-alanine--D-alanine ligase [Opitutaceae bacterium]